jgi:glycosyltransferase involved in cell wall biosynthesis
MSTHNFLYSRTQFWFDLKAGGSVGHTAGVVRGLQQSGNVHISANESLYGLDDVPTTILSPRIRSPRFIAESLYNLEYKPFFTRLVKSLHPDAIYHRYSGLSYATAQVAHQFNIPLILEFNSSELWTMKYWNQPNLLRRLTHPLREKWITQIEQYNLHQAALIVVVSEVLRDTLIHSGVPDEKILVNPNGVDPDQFKPLDSSENALIKQQWAIPENRIVVGFSGTYGEWHGIPDLAEGIFRLNQDPQYRSRLFFILFGDGKLRPLIEQKIGHFENVRFTGLIPYEKIAGNLSICDILLSPHNKTPDGERFFGSPTKLFEYMAMAKGIVASNLDQLGKVITHQRTGWLIEPGNIAELVTGIQTLADNDSLRILLGKAAREEVIAHYTWAAHVQHTVKALQYLQSSGEKSF